MPNAFEWRSVKTEYRDVLVAGPVEELRWLVNTEQIHDTTTGRTVTRSIIRHPGVAVIVPFSTAKESVRVSRSGSTIDDELWDRPAGTLHGREADGRVIAMETARACAERELLEECGYRAACWDSVARWYAMPGGNDTVVHLF